MIIKPDFPFKGRTTRHSALTTYQKFSSDQDPPENLTPSEFKDFKSLSKNKKYCHSESR